MVKILFVHGFNNFLSEERRNILEQYFEVIAPEFDYNNAQNLFYELSQIIENENIKAIIANSMGGVFAYYLAEKYDLPALCFNPALCIIEEVRKHAEIPEIIPKSNKITFVIGGKDTTVPALISFDWLAKNVHPDFILKWYNSMGHHTEISVLDIEVKQFFEKYFS